MPRYDMTAAQMGDLIAYLKKIGTESDADPGLTEDVIRLGSALPMSGPLARVGEDVKAALTACFTEVNSQGGVYGRRVELVVRDSRGDAAGTALATRELVEQDKVFALLGSFEPQDSHETNEFLRLSEVPLIGPVTLSPRLPVVPNRYVFYLLPSFADQARTLVDFVGSEETRPKARPASRVGVVYGDSDFDRDALAGLKSQSKMYSMEIVSEQGYKTGAISAATTVASLAAKKPHYVFFFGAAADMTSFAVEMDRANFDAGLLSSAVMVGRAAFSLSPAVLARTFFSYPMSLPDRDDLSEFNAVMQRARVNLRSAAFQAVAYAAAKVFLEAVKNSDRRFSRAALVNSLEHLQNFKTGVIGLVTFGPNRRVGAAGSYIVGVDVIKKQFVPVSARIVPKGSE
jgi:ABC-type branched-subunit amino acid transport system substrate-binding protein